MNGLTTRRATAADAERLGEVALASYQPYVARMDGQHPAPMDADYAHAVTHDVVWVAEEDGRLAGFLVLVDEPTTTLLENVAVHPDWQGRGVGRLLVGLAEEHARTTGKEAVTLYTNAAMVENMTLYAHLGYTEVGRRLDDGFDRVFYEKSVRAR